MLKNMQKCNGLFCNKKKPTDFVISTGKQYTVKEFINKTSKYLGIQLVWSGNGLNEIAKIRKLNLKKSNNLKIGQVVVKVDKRYFRPTEVENLLGDSKKAKKILGWKPKVDIDLLIKLMIENELKSQR